MKFESSYRNSTFNDRLLRPSLCHSNSWNQNVQCDKCGN